MWLCRGRSPSLPSAHLVNNRGLLIAAAIEVVLAAQVAHDGVGLAHADLVVLVHRDLGEGELLLRGGGGGGDGLFAVQQAMLAFS